MIRNKPGKVLCFAVAWGLTVPACRDASDGAGVSEGLEEAGEHWTFVEDLRIGAADGDGFLTDVGGATLNAHGIEVVATFPQQSTVRSYDSATGEVKWTAGRAGAGPGEFLPGGPRPIGTVGDTIWVFDGRTRRFTLLSATGEFLRSFAESGPVVEGIGFPPEPIGIAANGKLIGEVCSPVPEEQGRPCVLVSYALEDETAQPLAWYHRPALVSVRRERPNAIPVISLGTLPFSETWFVDIAPDGSSIVLVEAPHASNGVGALSVTRIGLEGDTVFNRSHALRAEELPRALVDSAAVDYRDTQYADQILGLTYGPPVTAVVHNADGSSLLRREDRGEATVEWIAIDSSGSIQGHMQLPTAGQVLVVDADHIWINLRESLDIPFLVRLRRSRD